MTMRRMLAPLGLALALIAPAPCLADQQRQIPASQQPPAGQTPPASQLRQPSAPAEQGKPAAASEAGDYLIGPDDVLEIAVWNNEKITRTVPVRPDGKISLPLLNDVQAAGLSAMQLRAFLTNALAAFVQMPEVSVIVREVHSFKVSVMGEVKEPGRFDLTSRVTVLDVLAMAKGFTEYADRGRIVVLRREQGITRPIPFEYQKVMSGSEATTGRENFFVQPGDVVLVR
jgi:polysaccharide export outer membrane protein